MLYRCPEGESGPAQRGCRQGHHRGRPHYAQVYDALHDRVAILAASDGPPLLGVLLHGAHGALISISLVGTHAWSEMVREATMGSAQRAKEIYARVARPIMRAVFEDHEPKTPISPFAATKEALVLMGEMRSARVRLPSVSQTRHE